MRIRHRIKVLSTKLTQISNLHQVFLVWILSKSTGLTIFGIGDKKTFYMDNSTFLTGVNAMEKMHKRIDEAIPRATEINGYSN